MVITQHFVFLHMPKTAGLWVAEILKPQVIERTRERHDTWQEIPAQYADLPQLAVVRNPWDWYVSWWLWWQRKKDKQDPPPDARLPFPDALKEMSERQEPGWVELREYGRYFNQFRKLVGPRTEVIRFENLREELLAFLRSHNALDHELERRVAAEPPVNAAERGDYRDYYDDESRELVARLSRPLIERFGYEF